MISSSPRPITQAVPEPNKQLTSFLGQVPKVVVYGRYFGKEEHSAENPKQRGRFGTVKQVAQAYSDITTEGALRHLIWQAESYARNPKANLKSNGFLAVIHRPGGGRKILLEWSAYERWLASGPQGMGAQS